MPVDAHFSQFTKKISAIVDDDNLVILEHDYTRDKVRRIQFDRVESLVTWRRYPLLHVLLSTLFFGGIGIALLVVQDSVANGIAAFMFSILAMLLFYYTTRQRSHIRIVRGGKTFQYAGFNSRRKFERFLEKLSVAISRTQVEAHEALQAAAVEATSRAEQVYNENLQPPEFSEPTGSPAEREQIELEPGPPPLPSELAREPEDDSPTPPPRDPFA